MIAFLKGIAQEVSKDKVILDVNGVGYEVFTSAKTLNDVFVSEPTNLWIYTHVREDAFKLFGFSSLLEKEVFLAFIGINGIGPKMALSLLSTAPSLKALLEMVEEEDIAGLSRLPRVGKKSAQQIILGLKGKLSQDKLKAGEEHLKSHKLLTTALLNLGFRSTEIKSALEHISEGKSIEEDLKKALSYLQPTGRL